MAPTIMLPSQPVSSFSLPHLKPDTASDMTSTTSTAGGNRPRRILWKFNFQGENKTDDAEKTLVATSGEESAKDETKRAEKRKPTFPTFSFSLGREEIDADLLAMSGRSAAKKKRTSLQNSFQDDLPSFSSNNHSDSMGSRYNHVIGTLKNEPTSSDGRRKVTSKFTAASQNEKNGDKVAMNAVDQTLVSKELEEPEKVKTWKNQKNASEEANQTLIKDEPAQPESTQFGFVPSAKANGVQKKGTLSTFSVSLTREEIEADFLAMAGSLRTRRIKKRPKNVQKQLDDLFPGLRLKYITPDDYKVRES